MVITVFSFCSNWNLPGKLVRNFCQVQKVVVFMNFWFFRSWPLKKKIWDPWKTIFWPSEFFFYPTATFFVRIPGIRMQTTARSGGQFSIVSSTYIKKKKRLRTQKIFFSYLEDDSEDQLEMWKTNKKVSRWKKLRSKI